MNRILALFLALALLVGLAACGRQTQSSDGPAQQTPAATRGDLSETGSAPDASASEETAAPQGLVTDGSRIGVLQTVQEQSAIRLKGLILTTGSGFHDYPGVEALAEEGFKTEGLCCEYCLDEWFEVYGELEGSDHVDVYVVANDPDADYAAYTPADLAAAEEQMLCSVYADQAFQNAQDYGHMFNACVGSELGPGLYNVFFTFDRTVCYMVQLKLVPFEA